MANRIVNHTANLTGIGTRNRTRNILFITVITAVLAVMIAAGCGKSTMKETPAGDALSQQSVDSMGKDIAATDSGFDELNEVDTTTSDSDFNEIDSALQ